MELDPRIRRATGDDETQLLRLIRDFYIADHHEYSEPDVLRALRPLLSDDALGQVWILDENGSPAGYAIVTWTWSLESGGRDCILDEIYVEQSGRGEGGRLLEHAIAEATRFGARALFLETEAHNDRARAFYGRHGMSAEDSIWMSMPLPGGSSDDR